VAQTTFAAPRIEEVAVPSHGVVLAGSLVLSGEQPIRAGVVFIHGSGKQARNLDLAKKFAAHGIAALVYDKRGAGQSGGEYEGDQSVSGPNIQLLADDAAAALAVLADHPALKGVPTGLAGISQAGWIAPLAAANNPRAKFLVLWSGPVCKVSEEDIYSKHTTDGDMAPPPPYAEALAARQVPYRWPAFLGRDTDAAADLGKLKIPGLWVFSDNDGSIPVDLSVAKLRALAAAGHRYDYRVFEGLGHNNIDSTFDTVVEWIRRLPR
jgi:pimeloyl-ACP methyl ester carboxylesterase